MVKCGLRWLVCATSVLVRRGAGLCGAGAGANDDPVTRARTHFEAGRALYQLGNYNEALREFAAGYQLAPRPQFLLNLGQCYRKLDDLPNAREMYQRYLHDAPASDPERPQAQQILAEIDKQIADGRPPGRRRRRGDAARRRRRRHRRAAAAPRRR